MCTRITVSRPRRASVTVRSTTVPFYKELYLPLPPFGGMRRQSTHFSPT
ncbi:MAG: hypothetical protein U0835_09735 [Isosphaeraceae bacterium]